MKDLFEIATMTLVVALILGLVFLFTGEPDLWDALHVKAMCAAGWPGSCK